MILIVCAWLYYFLVIFSIGSGSLKLIRKMTREDNSIVSYDVFYRFWFGFILLIGLLQLFSLFTPINTAVFIEILLLGLLSALVNYKEVFNELKLLYKQIITPKGIFSLFTVFFLILIISYSANREIEHADTFIYHFNAVKWIKEYSVLPGLANLHSRLGFNSSFLLFAALTDTGVYTGESAHIALSLLVVVCVVHWSIIITNPTRLMRTRIFCLLTLPYLLIHSFSRIDINSLSTDSPTAVLTLIFCLCLLDNFKHRILFVLPLSVVVFSFKLSGMLIVGIAAIILISYLIQLIFEGDSITQHKRILLVSSLLSAAIMIGFFVRNAFVSGWLIYPFPYGNLHLPWSVPKIYVLDMIDWIKSYPKIPGGASPGTIRENTFLFWFIPWFNQFRKLTEFNLFCAAVFLTSYSIYSLPSAKFYYARLNLLVLLVFSSSSIVFWFLSAPEVRFGSIYFYLFFAISFVIVYEGSRFKNSIVTATYFVFIYLALNEIAPRFVLDREPDLFTFTYTKPPNLKKVVASPPGEKPELFIYMPMEGDACGNSPLPCSPYAGGFLNNHRGVRQRLPGDISKGFLPLN